MSARGIRSSPIEKYSSERWVCAPHSRSMGTLTGPRLSFSTRVLAMKMSLWDTSWGRALRGMRYCPSYTARTTPPSRAASAHGGRDPGQCGGDVDRLAHHGREGVALRQPGGHGGDREAHGIEPRRDLRPAERAGDGRAGKRTRGQGRDDRLAVAVLQIVDVHLAAAIAHRAHDRGDPGLGLHAERGQEPGERPRLLVRVAGGQGEQDVQARGPGGLDVRGQLERLEDAVERAL